MNELLGWYGYSSVDRNDLSKSSKVDSGESHKTRSGVNSSMVSNMQNRRHQIMQNSQRGGGGDGPSSRTTNSTPDRCGNSSSPESQSHSPSNANTSNAIDTQGWYTNSHKLY